MSEETKKFNVVIVEDGKEYTAIIKTAVIIDGRFNLVHFENGWDAFLNIKDRVDVDLLITDVNMEKMNGFEMVERLKKLNKLPPTIFLTGRANKEDIKRGFQLGALDYVLKPLTPLALLDRIQNIANAPWQYGKKEA